MDTSERINLALEMIARGDPRFADYFQSLRKDDPLAFSLVEIDLLVSRSEPSLAIKKGARVLPLVGDNPRLARFLFMRLGTAYRLMGEMRASENHFTRALEIAERMGNKSAASRARLNLFYNKFCRAEYDSLREDLLKYRKEFAPPEIYGLDHLLAMHNIVAGRPEAALRALDSIIEATEALGNPGFWQGAFEMKGVALRLVGKLHEAKEAFMTAVQRYLDLGSAYAAFPLAKALELSRLANLEFPPDGLIRKCLEYAERGSWGEMAAAREIKALLADDSAETIRGLYESAESYHRAYQNIEAIFAGLTSAYLAWQTENAFFLKSVKLLAPLIPLHQGFKRDPILGRFLEGLEMFLVRVDEKRRPGIMASLIGGFRVFVGGREISLRSWHNDRAIMALLYLLLSPKHRLPKDHLFYLLWPNSRYNPRTKHRLHVAVSLIRKNLGDPSLLISSRDFYQLENAWTDLEEIENLIRRAEASQSSDEKGECLARARELARGELLPEFLYDQQVDEYRQYYERLRKRLFGE
ncbi:MAG: hypothetical protein ABIM88_08710 [candidate division WOR-3 bacterium]